MASELDSFFNYFPVLSKPKETLALEKLKASFVGGLKNFVVAALIYAFLNLVFFFIVGLQISDRQSGVLVGGFFGVLLLASIPIGSVLLTAAVYSVAKLLGGKGEFAAQYYLSSLYAVPLVALIAVVSFIIPPLFALFAVFFCGLYYLTRSLMAAHDFSMSKAVASWLIPGVILSVLLLVAFFVMAVIVYAATSRTPTG